MQRLLVIAGLELYAVALAILQTLPGVRTDEAKYLLDIPYPHPPAVRFLFGYFDSLPSQELFVRVLLASLMVQVAWLIWDMAKDLLCPQRLGLCVLWLVSGGVLLQAGTVMMAPITALQALLILFCIQKKVPPMLIGLLWLFSLFTAYQAVLFAPLLVLYFWREQCPRIHKVAYVCIPILLLALYTLTNPLIPASMLIHSGRDVGSSITDRSFAVIRLWAIGGSVILSLFGTKGMLHARNWGLIFSLLLIILYIALSRYDYYAVLFLPLFIGGVLASPSSFVSPKLSASIAAVIGCILFVRLMSGLPVSTARSTVLLLQEKDAENTLLINGSFGHEWQYESFLPVRRFTGVIPEDAGALVCLQSCLEWNRTGWELIQAKPETWVRSGQLA
jgi:hypothetical protein